MAGKIECPEIDGIYCLDHFWDHNAMPEDCRRILSKDLGTYYDMFKQGNDKNSLIWRENAIVISLCPGHHRGANGNLRLVMIADPRKNRKDYMVCLFFPEYHNNQYSDAIKKASSVYKAFQDITFATKKDLERFEQNASAGNIRPLVVVGFYKVIFEESKDKDQILQAYDEAEKKSNIMAASQKQMESTYIAAIQELYGWHEILTDNGYTAANAYKEVFEQLFQDFTAKYGNDWSVHIKSILINKPDKASKFILSQLSVWENGNGGPGYPNPQGGRDF